MLWYRNFLFALLYCSFTVDHLVAVPTFFNVSDSAQLSKALFARSKEGKTIINLQDNVLHTSTMSSAVCGESKCCYYVTKELEISYGTVEINGKGESCIIAAHGYTRIFHIKSAKLLLNDVSLKHGRQEKGGGVLVVGEDAGFWGRNIDFEDNYAAVIGGAAYVSSFAVFDCHFCQFLNNRGGIHATYGASIFLQRDAVAKCNSCEFEKGFSKSSKELAAMAREFHIAHAEDFNILSDL